MADIGSFQVEFRAIRDQPRTWMALKLSTTCPPGGGAPETEHRTETRENQNLIEVMAQIRGYPRR